MKTSALKEQPNSAARNHIIRIRFNDDEIAKLEELCEESGRNKCDLLRDHLGKLTVKNRAEVKKTNAWLGRINSNVNQVARWVNTYKSKVEAQSVLEELALIRVAIENLVEKGTSNAD